MSAIVGNVTVTGAAGLPRRLSAPEFLHVDSAGQEVGG